MAKLGRPKKNIDVQKFEKLCGLQCTKEEIASFFNCSEDTIENFCKRQYKETFSAVFNKKRGLGKISLRRSQWKLAEKSPAMAIFLGKQYLNQTDKVMNIITDDDADPLSKAFEELMNGNNSIQQETTADTGISEE
jgi:hypothetical protein